MARTFIEAGSARQPARLPKQVNAPSSAELVAWLKCPATYAERPAEVECRETHISWVFLAGRYVYKLADNYTTHLGPTAAIVVTGLMGSGKSSK